MIKNSDAQRLGRPLRIQSCVAAGLYLPSARQPKEIFVSLPYEPKVVHLQKAKLINLGLFALSRGEWQIVMAITHLIGKRGLAHV
jgi:hypothetical protein